MVASVNKEALEYSIQHKVGAFYSTSRNSLWIKGETSGHYFHIKEILMTLLQKYNCSFGI